MGIYGTIFKKIKEKRKQQKPKKMPKTAEQKKARRDKIKALAKKGLKLVQSGKAEAVVGGATRYSQGKAVVIKGPKTEDTAPQEFINIFGQPLPKNVVYIGGGILGLGAIYLISKAVKPK